MARIYLISFLIKSFQSYIWHRKQKRCRKRFSEEEKKDLEERNLESHFFRNRWEPERVKAILEDVRANALVKKFEEKKDWTRHLLKDVQERWEELPRIDDCQLKKLDTEKAPRDLRGFPMTNELLVDTDGFAGACMDYASFENVQFRGGSLVAVSIQYADVCGFSEFAYLNMRNTQFCKTRCRGVSFKGSDLRDADFSGADLRGADFRKAEFRSTNYEGIKFSKEPFMGFIFYSPLAFLAFLLSNLAIFAIFPISAAIPLFLLLIGSFGCLLCFRTRLWTRFGGLLQQEETLTPELGLEVKNFILGENHLWSVKKQYPFLGRLWYIIANCGLSPERLLFWALLIWVLFGIVYAEYPLPSCLKDTYLEKPLCKMACNISWPKDKTNLSAKRPTWYEPYYFSAVTMTTLGYGDIHPKPMDTKAQVYTMTEAVLGYVLLGMFISLFLKHKGG